MDIVFSLFVLCGGLAFFLYGMNVMSSGLERMAGGKLEQLLKKMTSNPIKSLVLGAGITIAIQSSSAMTVMLVGLVNSGVMQLGQTIGVIMGSNIGTTLTAWILSLAGIESEGNFFIELLKPSNFSPLLAFIGILLIMASKKQKRKDVGGILVGFAILMYGMELMKDAMEPITQLEGFNDVLTAFSNPLLGVLVGAVFTGVIQSSAASVGILQTLSMSGGVTYGMALPIIMGQNIGTCVTALLSSIGVNKNAKKVSVVHISFNLIGTTIILAVFYGLHAIFNFAIVDQPIDPFGIAICHTIFNVVTTALLLPFTKQLEKIANFVIKDDKDKKEEYTFVDQRLLSTPSVAIAQCYQRTIKMAEVAHGTILSVISLFGAYDKKKVEEIVKNEDELDLYEDKLGTVLVQLASKELSAEDSKQVSKLLHTIGDFERLGDHGVNVLRVVQELHNKKITFSKEAQAELEVLTNALTEILQITVNSFETGDTVLAVQVEPLEQVIDSLIMEIKAKHITRLKKGQCTIELGFILSDLLNDYARISDHCSNIAVALIEVEENHFDTHEYLNAMKKADNPEFVSAFNAYQEKYALPK